MDEQRIGLVLARASELSLKINNCIHKTTPNNDLQEQEQEEEQEEEEEEEEENSDSLWNIRDALEALEAQLSSLQALQQQQWYEKEAALAEIELSQKKLLKRLEEYEGKYLQVINEAIAFVGETVDDNNDLLLPPYPSGPSPALLSDSGYLSQFTIAPKYPRNGQSQEFSKNLSTDKNKMVPESKSPVGGIKMLIGAAAKATFTVAGIICILCLAGFEPRLKRRDNIQFNIWALLPQQEENNEKKGKTVECPAGRIPVIEDGEVRCLVKERVEVPFVSVVATPDVDYGCG